MVHLDNIFMIVYVITTNRGLREFSKLSERNGKLPLTQLEQGNYPVIPIYVIQTVYYMVLQSSTLLPLCNVLCVVFQIFAQNNSFPDSFSLKKKN